MARKQTVYLVNNRPKEPEFAAAFQHEAAQKKTNLATISSLDCAFFYDRSQHRSTLFVDGDPVSLARTNWFIRRWAPSEDASALLSFFLELHCIPFTDARVNSAHEIRTSKLSQTFQLTTHGCDCPSTWVVPITSFKRVSSAVEKTLNFPLVIKTRGGLGQRVWLIRSKTALHQKITELRREKRDDLVILQEMIENRGDVRVIVFQDKILVSIERYNPDSFLHNVSQGAHATTTRLDQTETRLALRATKTIGLELAGVDIVRTAAGPLVFEVNKAPDIVSFDQAAGFNIAAEIAARYFSSLS